jgi:hypothetical protein
MKSEIWVTVTLEGAMSVMSQAAYARRHGVSPKTATKWKQSGLIVVTEAGVDVEESDERLRRYRYAEDGRAQRGPKKRVTHHGTPAALRAPEGNAAGAGDALVGNDPAGLRELSVEEIRRRLHALDWTQPAPVGEAQMRDRARAAARCVGLVAAESDVQDDGHWGGFQLRDLAWWGNPEAYPDQEVVGGFGFELTVLQVLRLCRMEAALEEPGWEGTVCRVNPELLAALAYPHYQGQKPDATNKAASDL